MNGIYCYVDKQNENKVVYIGRDSSIHIKRRHREHISKKRENSQPFNKVLQKNPNRFQYQVLEYGNFSNQELNLLERKYIKKYGTYSNRKGYGESYGFNFTEGGDGFIGFTLTQNQRIKQVQSAGNKTGFFRLSKRFTKKKGWIWTYSYSKNKKRIKMEESHLGYLLEAIIHFKLPWYVLDYQLALETCNQHGYDKKIFIKNYNIEE